MISGILVGADGRTYWLDDVNGALWYIKPGDIGAGPNGYRYFLCQDIARNGKKGDGECWVYVEQPKSVYDKKR